MKPRARQILVMKANGMLSKQIADELGIHRRTVEWHLSQACIELHAKNVTHAVAKAVRDGLIATGEIGMVLLLSWSSLWFVESHVDVRRGPSRPPTSRTVRRDTKF